MSKKQINSSYYKTCLISYLNHKITKRKGTIRNLIELFPIHIINSALLLNAKQNLSIVAVIFVW